MPPTASAVALVIAAAGCGAPPRFHPDPERGCVDAVVAGQEDVAAAAGCSSLASLTIRTGMALDLSPLGRLHSVRGAIAIGPSVGLAEVSLPRLTTAGSIRIVANGNLGGVFLPRLEHCDRIEIEGNGAQATLSLPVLRGPIARLSIADNPALELVDLSALTEVGELAIERNPKLAMIEADALTRAASVRIERNAALSEDQIAALRAKSGAP